MSFAGLINPKKNKELLTDYLNEVKGLVKDFALVRLEGGRSPSRLLREAHANC